MITFNDILLSSQEIITTVIYVVGGVILLEVILYLILERWLKSVISGWGAKYDQSDKHLKPNHWPLEKPRR